MKKKTMSLKKIQQIILKIVLVISSIIFSNILIASIPTIFRIINTIICTVITTIIIKKVDISKLRIKEIIISILLSIYVSNLLVMTKDSFGIFLANKVETIIGYSFINELTHLIIVAACIPILSMYIYMFIDKIIPKVKDFIKKLTQVEKKYVIITSIVGIIISGIIITTTTAFTLPVPKELDTTRIYDVIFTADNGALTATDAYLNPGHEENDLRQPLFGVLASPFSVIAHIGSEMLPFTLESKGYYFLLIVIQFVLASITTIMIGKLLELEEKNKKYLYLLFSLSFPYMLFSILLEQYVIALFYLILTIYLYKELKGINYAYIGSTGSLLTSGILFPLVTKGKKIKDKIKDLFQCFIAFCTIFLLSGGIRVIANLFKTINGLTKYTGADVTILNKFQQFTHFIKSLFFGTEGHITYLKTIWADSYQISPITTISIIGIVILVLCIISAFINRKKYITKVSIVWVIFSVIMLFVLGWGTQENGLVLYSLYFGWAYFVLIFQLLQNIFKNPKVFKIAIAVLIISMLCFSLPELYNILKFAILYY